MSGKCWVCGSPVEVFYTVEDIPSSSCVLHLDRERAVQQARGRLELAVCRKCGFIQNDVFEQSLVDYTAPYEESQAASPTFQRFAEETIERLIERYDLRGGHILEVGCGKAEWLAMACRMADATATGIDPGFVPGRFSGLDPDRIEIKLDFFDEESMDTGDLVVCRHTLEHVPATATFTRWLVDAARRNPNGVIFVEVPDTEQILRQGAFWDVYYEHCAYFTIPSLRNLSSEAGFETIHLELGYDDQYLLLEARPGAGVSGADPSAVVEAALVFGKLATEQIVRWQQALSGRSQAVLLWGATSKTVSFLSAVGTANVVAAADINPAKHGSYLPGSGVAVVAPEDVPDLEIDLVIAMNPIYRSEIAADLDRLGVTASLMALGDL